MSEHYGIISKEHSFTFAHTSWGYTVTDCSLFNVGNVGFSHHSGLEHIPDVGKAKLLFFYLLFDEIADEYGAQDLAEGCNRNKILYSYAGGVLSKDLAVLEALRFLCCDEHEVEDLSWRGNEWVLSIFSIPKGAQHLPDAVIKELDRLYEAVGDIRNLPKPSDVVDIHIEICEEEW